MVTRGPQKNEFHLSPFLFSKIDESIVTSSWLERLCRKSLIVFRPKSLAYRGASGETIYLPWIKPGIASRFD